MLSLLRLPEQDFLRTGVVSTCVEIIFPAKRLQQHLAGKPIDHNPYEMWFDHQVTSYASIFSDSYISWLPEYHTETKWIELTCFSDTIIQADFVFNHENNLDTMAVLTLLLVCVPELPWCYANFLQCTKPVHPPTWEWKLLTPLSKAVSDPFKNNYDLRVQIL